MRPIKFRAWHKDLKIMREVSVINFDHNEVVINRKESEFDHANFISKSTWFEGTFELMQFTGLYDRNGKEIYELMILDNKYEVNWRKGKYILIDISNGDIMDLNYDNSYAITEEYSKISKDSKGSSY